MIKRRDEITSEMYMNHTLTKKQIDWFKAGSALNTISDVSWWSLLLLLKSWHADFRQDNILTAWNTILTIFYCHGLWSAGCIKRSRSLFISRLMINLCFEFDKLRWQIVISKKSGWWYPSASEMQVRLVKGVDRTSAWHFIKYALAITPKGVTIKV